MHNHNLVSIPTRVYQLEFSISTPQLINDNNNYVNLHDVTNLGLYNKLILVTQKQVLELYITAIEHKTLYGLHIPHTTFSDATKATTNATTNEVHVTEVRGIRTSQNTNRGLVEKQLSRLLPVLVAGQV